MNDEGVSHYVEITYNDGATEKFGVANGDLTGDWENAMWLNIDCPNGNVFKISLREVRRVSVQPRSKWSA